ncbi:MAG: DUF1080 domain-containing protein, partial [Chloroflexota bacterium]|nr:DUF1080 domain-containing protein [Chloroflexota bacterium]
RGTAVVPPTLPVAPTSVPPTPTPAPTLAPLPEILADGFDQPDSGFPPQPEGREGSGYQNGEYAIVVPDPEGLVIAERAGSESIGGDLAIEVDARAAGPAAGGSYGLVLRRQSTAGAFNQYFVLIDPNAGTVRLIRWSGTARLELIPPTLHEAIARGEAPNHLAVNVRGGQFTIQINGAQVAQATDPAPLGPGRIALRADAGAGPITVRFDNLKVRPPR